MISRFRYLFMAILLVALVGCSGVAAGPMDQVDAIDSTEVTRSLQWVDGREMGPVYNLSVTVPEAWGEGFSTRTRGNTLAFMVVQENGQMGIVFEIRALSPDQYWQQVGSYPGTNIDVVNKVDTYFVYNVPIFAADAGLPKDLFESLKAEVPAIVQSFSATSTTGQSAMFQMP